MAQRQRKEERRKGKTTARHNLALRLTHSQVLRCLSSFLFLLSSFLCPYPAYAGSWNIPAPDLPARAFVLIEAQSGTELAAFSADERLPPASLTKLMTAYVLFGELRAGRLKLDEHITVSRYAAHLPGARMFLREGDQVPAEELFKGMLVQSGNDATFALVERVSGTLPVFVARMNAIATELGLTNTHFANATGLNNPQHYSSARDLTRLAVAVQRDFPEYAGWFALPEYRWSGIAQPNRNPLLRDPGVDGLKTGHTEAAGYCLVASAQRDGMRLVATLLGTDSEPERARSGRRLLDFGFRQFETRLLYRSGMPVATLPVWQGEIDAVALGVNRDVWITLPRGSFTAFSAQIALPQTRLAPVTHGETLGRLELMHNNQPLAELPLVALATVPEGSLAKRATDRLRRWLREQGLVQAAP
jgi:serine-type D-Ala-D-Ala carboxypeptidase (penicillin-binding protein 5/6)